MDILEQQPLKVTVIAGGTGGANIAGGLLEAIGNSEMDVDLTVLTSIGDSGSKTGELRSMIGGAAVGDLRKILSEVSDNAGGELFKQKFGPEADISTVESMHQEMLGVLAVRGLKDRGQIVLERATGLASQLPKGLYGHSYGNLVLAALHLEHEGRLTPAVLEAGCWLDARARVLPVTDDPHDVVMRDGDKTIFGEGAIDDYEVGDPRSAQIRLTPQPGITPEAQAAITDADIFVVGPGSLFTSILPALQTVRFNEALRTQSERSDTHRVLIANLVEERNATRGLRIPDYIAKLEGVMGVPFTHVFHNTNTSGIPAGEVPLHYHDGQLTGSDATFIGMDLVGLRTRPQKNDFIPNLRSTLTTRADELTEALLSIT